MRPIIAASVIALVAACGSGTRDGSASQGAPAAVSTFVLRVSVSGAGRVTSQPAAIDCGGACTASFQAATLITLVADPASASRFGGWSGACSGTDRCLISMEMDQQVSARFAAIPSPDACANLHPAVAGGTPGRHVIDEPIARLCVPGQSDGYGTLALQAGNGEVNDFTVHFVGPDGELRKALAQTNLALTEQLAGFEGMSLGIDPASNSFAWTLGTWDREGRSAAQIPLKPGDQPLIGPDPLGGMMVQSTSSPEELRAYDERLLLRWRVPLSGAIPWGSYGSSVDRAGNTLVLFIADMARAPNTIDAMWIDHDGHTGPRFRLAGPFPDFPSQVWLAQRVGSGFFIRIEGQWKGQIESESTSLMSPAPPWLAARPGTTLHMVRNGTGYAVLPAGTDLCQPLTIEIFAPDGSACGAASFQASPGPTNSCRYESVTVGYDGTVMLSYNLDSNQCVWEWWPGFLG